MTKHCQQSGQTIIALLIFMMLSIVVTTAAVAVTVVNTETNSGYTSGELALEDARSGAENALLQLERNPSYSGESLSVSPGNTATITVSGSGNLTIVSVGTSGAFQRTITVTATYSGNVLTENSWMETP